MPSGRGRGISSKCGAEERVGSFDLCDIRKAVRRFFFGPGQRRAPLWMSRGVQTKKTTWRHPRRTTRLLQPRKFSKARSGFSRSVKTPLTPRSKLGRFRFLCVSAARANNNFDPTSVCRDALRPKSCTRPSFLSFRKQSRSRASTNGAGRAAGRSSRRACALPQRCPHR